VDVWPLKLLHHSVTRAVTRAPHRHLSGDSRLSTSTLHDSCNSTKVLQDFQFHQGPPRLLLHLWCILLGSIQKGLFPDTRSHDHPFASSMLTRIYSLPLSSHDVSQHFNATTLLVSSKGCLLISRLMTSPPAFLCNLSVSSKGCLHLPRSLGRQLLHFMHPSRFRQKDVSTSTLSLLAYLSGCRIHHPAL